MAAGSTGTFPLEIEMDEEDPGIGGVPPPHQEMADSMRTDQPLPSVDEIRLNSDSDLEIRRQRRQKKLVWIFGIVFVIMAILAIGMGIGFASRNDKNEDERVSSSVVDDEPTDSDKPNSSDTEEDRQAGIKKFLQTLMVPGNKAALDDTLGPQYKAMKWLLEDDSLKLGIPETKGEEIRLSQRFALLTIYYATGGYEEINGWRDQYFFAFRTLHECDWNKDLIIGNSIMRMGVGCSFITLPAQPDDESQEEEKVPVPTLLRLAWNDLGHTLPDEIGLLSHLTTLDVRSNELYGEIPSALSKLTDLSYIFLDRNNFRGLPILDWMQKSWKNVKVLNLAHNNFRGTISSSIGGLTSLRQFGAYWNANVTGTIPTEILQLTNLEAIHLQYCNCDGPLPQFAAPSFTQLTEIILSNNMFTSSIPPEYGTLTNLRLLFLDDNLLTSGTHQGGLRATLNPLTKMRRMYLEDNLLEYTIEPNDGFLQNMIESGLERLDLSDNYLYGIVPAYFFNGPNLSLLDLHGNKLGQLPPVLDDPNEEPTYVAENPLPEDDVLVNNPKLSFIALHDNSLVGSIPPSFVHLQNLAYLDLSNNLLSGGIPTELGELTKMRFLFLASNPELDEGPIPDWIQNMTNLEELSFKQSSRTGVIPSWIGTQLSNLLLLDLDMNGFEGPIPSTFGELSELRFLLLNRNKLEGNIPPQLANLTNLQLLLLDENKLVGDAEGLFCDGPNLLGNLSEFYSDCGGSGDDSSSPQVNCPCCTLCCDEANTTCNDDLLLANYEPIWELSFGRRKWDFGSDEMDDFAV